MTKENIKEKFLKHALEHGEAIAEGDHKKANKIHKKLQKIYGEAKEQEALNVFVELLDEKEESVLLWAATFSLKNNPDVAVKSLEKLTGLTTITGISAKTTLHLWKEGKLDLL